METAELGLIEVTRRSFEYGFVRAHSGFTREQDSQHKYEVITNCCDRAAILSSSSMCI